MLVQCKSCNVSFDDSLGKCIVCGDPITMSREELKSHCVLMARKKYRLGVTWDTIRSELIDQQDLADEEADVIIQAAKEIRKEAARQKGRQAIGIGVTFLLAGVGLTFLSLGAFVFVGFLIGGAILFLGGAFTVWTGWDITGDNDD